LFKPPLPELPLPHSADAVPLKKLVDPVLPVPEAPPPLLFMPLPLPQEYEQKTFACKGTQGTCTTGLNGDTVDTSWNCPTNIGQANQGGGEFQQATGPEWWR